MNQYCNLLRKKYNLALINQRIECVCVCVSESEGESLRESVSICVAEIKSLYWH